MINSTPEYKAAIVGDSRRMYIKAKVHIVDPDIVYGSVSGSTQLSGVSKPEQIYDGNTDVGRPYITLEPNRWLLDGTFDAAEDMDAGEEYGYVANTPIARSSSTVSRYVELSFSGVDLLKTCVVVFPDDDYDGVPEDFTIQIKQGNTVAYEKAYTGNTESVIKVSGFSVSNPTAIRVNVTKMSLDYRRFRVLEIVVGVHEEWNDSVIAEFSVVHQTNMASTSLPYGVAKISFDNSDRRFDPYNKDGLFESLEERQGIDLYLGVGINGVAEYKKLGVFYQYADGWKMRSGLTITWSLVDIIGLLAERPYTVPSPLPTTLDGWLANLVSQLGTNFSGFYDVSADYASTSVTANATDLQKQKCGQILMWLCQASGTWARADPESGKLKIYPIPTASGNEITLGNQVSYPTIRANDDLARIDFTFPNGTEYSVAGNIDAAEVVSIRNPFINTSAKADRAAAVIKQMYGGNSIETIGRGDPTDELGDIVTVETEHGDIQGRLIYADYKYKNGVLTSCVSKMIEVESE